MVLSVVQLHVKVYIYVSVFRSSWRPVFQNTQIGQPNSHQEHFAIVGYPLPNMCGAPVPSRMSKGSHGIQERLPVDTSKSITFGNETAGTGDTTVMSKVSASFPNEKALTVSQAGSVLGPAGRGGEGGRCRIVDVLATWPFALSSHHHTHNEQMYACLSRLISYTNTSPRSARAEPWSACRWTNPSLSPLLPRKWARGTRRSWQVFWKLCPQRPEAYIMCIASRFRKKACFILKPRFERSCFRRESCLCAGWRDAKMRLYFPLNQEGCRRAL